MRVIAGALRGRRLEAPAGTATRPTSDRVREATFNALGSMGAIDGAEVLDAFAGSGALGIEALSRGAARCTFVERDRRALAALRSNLQRCGLGRDRAVVVAGVAGTVVHAGDAGVVVVAGDAGAMPGPWDLALLDPPYAYDGWEALLDGLDAAVAVCESGAPIVPVAGWALVREKAYGATVVTILARDPARTTEEERG